MKYQLALASLAFVVALALDVPARADVGLGGGALIGTGVDTGDANNNPYRLQLGGYGELNIGSLLLGVRGTRSLGSEPEACTNECKDPKGLRTLGGDVGYIWHLPLIHLGPRLGIGYLKERDAQERTGAYFEPGASLDVHLAIFNVGAELRYRFVTNASEANGFLAYLRLGLAFGL